MLRVVLSLLLLTSCANEPEIHVFAAASLTDALTEIGTAYEHDTGRRIVFNFAGSQVLARQIESGAPADLFLSADERTMQRVKPIERVRVLSNRLVLVGARNPHDLLGKRVALGDPATVPAGVYARQYLTGIGLWDRIARNVIPAENVRAALAAVRTGNADAAIVYRTDAKGIEIADGPPISYPFALLRDSAEARRFFDHLRSPAARAVFARHGFIVL